jgi:hypothetical protein
MRGDQGGLVADLHLAGAAVDLHLAADQCEGHRVGPALEAHRAVVRHLAADHDVEGTGQRQQLAEQRPLLLPRLDHRAAGRRAQATLGTTHHFTV